MNFSRAFGKVLSFPLKVVGGIFRPGGKRPVKLAVLILFLALAAGFFVYPKQFNSSLDRFNSWKNETFLKTLPNLPQMPEKPFRLGLDLQGGTHLIYEANLSNIKEENYAEAMQGVRDVIERRVNLFGVTEPLVQVDRTGDHHRLIVELAGVKDVSQAITMIGETPALDFREEKPAEETQAIIEAQKNGERIFEDPYFSPSELTGRYLKDAQVIFDPNTYEPMVSLEFDEQGSRLFEELTRKNVGKRLAIYLDGLPISAPVVNEAISGGRAQISGNFSIEEAKELTRRMNAGALPVPIELINQQSIGASLGEESLQKSLRAGFYGFIAVAVFMVIWYRLFGLVAVLALIIYTAIALSIFKLIPVTMTLAGIAGFILSIGMAVDANILIFERIKEELRWGKNFEGALREGFARAWPSIRDSNVSSLITCAILFWLGTSIIQGFALTLALGILVSMFSAISVTRTILRLLTGSFLEKKIFYMRDKRPKETIGV